MDFLCVSRPKIENAQYQDSRNIINLIYPYRIISVSTDGIYYIISTLDVEYMVSRSLFSPENKSFVLQHSDGQYINIDNEKLPIFIWNLITYEKYSSVRRDAYEVSSVGNKKFSAWYAYLRDGRSIEEAYQLDIKGFREKGLTAKEAKSKPALIERPIYETHLLYTLLWWKYLKERPQLIKELRSELTASNQTVLSDLFANSFISQARSLAEILNAYEIIDNGVPTTDYTEPSTAI